jgi:hypothetical protein
MSSRSVVMKPCIAIVLLAAAGCDAGNYSNEDLDFLLAVPERQDIAVRLPTQALETNDSAEYYTATRNTVKSLDATADAFLALIDHVRAHPPSERHADRRVWGPFPVMENPLFLIRLVVDRLSAPGQPLRFRYSVEFRARADQSGVFAPLITGEFTPSGEARKGTGVLHFTSMAARAASYPLGGLLPIDSLDIEYRTDAFPLRIKVTLVTFPARETWVYEHTEEQDGAGSMLFTFPTPGPVITSVRIRSRWLGSGAGRADIDVLAGLPIALNAKGVDCWGIDTRPTYVHRDWDRSVEFGVASDCVFPAPPP